MINEKTQILESALRLILWRQFEGDVVLDRVLPGEEFCIVVHADGTRGSIPVRSVVLMEAA